MRSPHVAASCVRCCPAPPARTIAFALSPTPQRAASPPSPPPPFSLRPDPVPLPLQREFTQAEIEFFCQPGDKKFEKFALIKSLRLQLLSSPLQLEGKPATERTLEEAVASGTIANEVRTRFRLSGPVRGERGRGGIGCGRRGWETGGFSLLNAMGRLYPLGVKPYRTGCRPPVADAGP
jgi:hypothetical protein